MEIHQSAALILWQAPRHRYPLSPSVMRPPQSWHHHIGLWRVCMLMLAWWLCPEVHMDVCLDYHYCVVIVFRVEMSFYSLITLYHSSLKYMGNTHERHWRQLLSSFPMAWSKMGEGQHWFLSVNHGWILKLQSVLFLIVCRTRWEPTVTASRQEAQERQIYCVGKGGAHAAVFHSEGLLFAIGIREGTRCKNWGWFWQGGKEDHFLLT